MSAASDQTASAITDHKGNSLAVFNAMRDGRWRTLACLLTKLMCIGTNIPVQSVSARLRDLRKDSFGGHEVKRRATDVRGLFEYRLVVRK